MIVIVLTDCPPKVRGDLSKWLIEINTGVYVGQINARVREQLWQRICENLRTGRAAMVYSAAGEQHLDFRVHNTTWEPVDFDGLKLMRRPSPPQQSGVYGPALPKGFSKAAKRQKIRRIQAARNHAAADKTYTVMDIETTGLSCTADSIIELAALRVENGTPGAVFEALVQCEKPLPKPIEALTGITDALLAAKGKPLADILPKFLAFLGDSRVVCHNAAFDYNFLQAACRRAGLGVLCNPCVDTLVLARRKLDAVEDYKLATIANYFALNTASAHRALSDCYLTNEIYQKLKGL